MLKLHSILMNGSIRCRFISATPVRIAGVNLPTANYIRVPDLMPRVMASATKVDKDIIGLVASVHSQFEQIHPFLTVMVALADYL